MRFSKLAIAVLMMALLAGCASHGRLNTASGRPEAIFFGATTESVKGRIANGCIANGLAVFEMSDNHVTAGKQLSGGEAMMMQLAIGNSYSTPPVRKVQFLIFRNENDVKVTAQEWVETQMAFGQLRQVELNSARQMQSLQQFLRGIGGV